MSSRYLDFSSCGIVPGFCKSGHNYSLLKFFARYSRRQKSFNTKIFHMKISTVEFSQTTVA